MKRVVVIGGGIAGASVAYFLGRAGVEVTVVDAGQYAASQVPSALVNPVRGQSGGVAPRALEGQALTWALLDELNAAGYAVPHGQTGVLRPVPDEKARARFTRHLPPELPHEWRVAGPPLAPGWAQTLWLPGGGWLDGGALCAALLAVSGAQLVRGRATAWSARQVAVQTAQAVLTLDADAVVWCGGSVGHTWANTGDGEAGIHRMGSLLTLDRAVTPVPVSFGAYLAPAAGGGGVLGATFEAPTPTWRPPALPLSSLRWLLERGERLSDLQGARLTGRWTGSRLSGLRCGPDNSGVWYLSGLGSKGFLLGPLLGRDLAARMVEQRVLGP